MNNFEGRLSQGVHLYPHLNNYCASPLSVSVFPSTSFHAYFQFQVQWKQTQRMNQGVPGKCDLKHPLKRQIIK